MTFQLPDLPNPVTWILCKMGRHKRAFVPPNICARCGAKLEEKKNATSIHAAGAAASSYDSKGE